MNDEAVREPSRGSEAIQHGQTVYLVRQQDVTPKSIDIGLADIWRVVWSGKWFVVASVVLFSALGVTYALLAQPVYKADVSLLQVETRGSQGLGGQLSQLGGLASLAGINIGGANRVEPLAVLRSREFAQQFIERNGIEKILLQDMWDEKAGKWKEEGKAAPDIRDAVEKLNRRVRRITDDRKVGLITLSIQWKDGETAARWANAMVKQVNEQMRERALMESSDNLKYLQTELASASQVSLQQAIGRMIQAEMERAMLAKGNPEYAFRVIDKAQIPKHRAWPRRALICIAAAFAGGVIGLAFVLFRSRLLSGRSDAPKMSSQIVG